MDCGATAIGSNCTTSDYGDTLDIMGNPSSAHFNAFQKDRLGWLDYNVSPPITSVQTSGTYTIAPYEPLGSTAKALSVVKSTDHQTGNRTWYYIEYRQAIGFDSFLSSNNNVAKGVVIHTGSEASSNSSYLLDMTPETSSWSDPALVVGKSFYDPDAGVAIAPVAVSSMGTTVSVSFEPLACVRTAPSVALSPSQTQWVQPGSSVTYTVTVTNNDNTGCTASSFLLESLVPSGWTADFVTAALSISPGASAATTLRVTSPASATDGFYDLEVMATNSTDAASTASTWATVVLMSSLDVTAATDKSSYPTNTSVSLTANVRADGTPVANASVVFTITKATGAVMQQTATTGANGPAVSQFRLKKNDPLGTYQVVAAANVNGISGSGSTSFTVTK